MLFHEIYGSYFHTVALVLEIAVQKTLTGRALTELIQKHAFGESFLSIPEGLQGESWRVLRKDLSTPLHNIPSTPVTLLEKSWLKSLLLDPRIRLFEPDVSGLEDIEPLFIPEMIVWYERNNDGDDYADPVYIAHFKTILQALRENRNIYVKYKTRRHANPGLVVTPYYLEYSEKDDRFRLVAAGRKRSWVFNLSQIEECSLSENKERAPLKDPKTSFVTFVLKDRRNAMERVLLHFSHLKKETKRLDETTYRVSLWYDPKDETEMVIRILSFGAAVRVTAPEHFVELIRQRIEQQKKLVTFLPCSGKENVLE